MRELRRGMRDRGVLSGGGAYAGLGRPPKLRDKTGLKDANGDGSRMMESDIIDRPLEMPH
jgi:hypothetical protein